MKLLKSNPRDPVLGICPGQQGKNTQNSNLTTYTLAGGENNGEFTLEGLMRVTRFKFMAGSLPLMSIKLGFKR